MIKYALVKLPMIQNQEIEGEFLKIKYESELVEVGDQYHRLSELYDHRRALSSALFRIIQAWDDRYICFRSKFHADDSMFEGYFITGIQDHNNKCIISYHYELSYWNDFWGLKDLEKAPEYDGHTSEDVINRLLKLL